MENKNTYHPISCEQHSQYELAVMHKNKLYLRWKCDDDLFTENNILALDIKTKNKAEYLSAVTETDKNICIQLDHIIEMRILD